MEFWAPFIGWAALAGLLVLCILGWLVWKANKEVGELGDKLSQQISDVTDRFDLELEILEREVRNLKDDIRSAREERRS